MRYDPAVRDQALDALANKGLSEAHWLLIRQTGADKRVLEIGCASGYISRELRAAGCRVTGMEIDPDAAEQARPFLEQLIVGDVERGGALGRAGTGYDVVLMGDVLEHLTDPERFLRSLLPVFGPAGYALAAIPNVAFFKMRWSLLRGRFDYTDCGLCDRTHLRFYTFYSFQEMVQRAGYRIDQFWIDEGRIPGRLLWGRIPLLNRLGQRLEARAIRRWPNLFGFHLTFRLNPSEAP